MNKDKISAFTLRIASSNGTGLISVLYDIYKEYEEEALASFENGMVDEAIASIRKCSEVVAHLQKDLNFDYSVSRDLYALYDYVQRCLSRSIYQSNTAGIEDARDVMGSLAEAFEQIASQDYSAPLMQNTQQVRAGFTYGRTSLNEDLIGNQTSRGYWA